MKRVPCEFSDVYHMLNGKPYRYIYFHCLVFENSNDCCCPISIVPFTSMSDMMDNLEFAKESGVNVYTDVFKDICHESRYPELWKLIEYYVSCTDND